MMRKKKNHSSSIKSADFVRFNTIIVTSSRIFEFSVNFKYEETRVVDLEENPEFSQLSAASAFFKSESFKFDNDNSNDQNNINNWLKQFYD